MDTGDADVELVLDAGLDGERVLVVAALRVREASTRASGGAHADEATTGGELGWTRAPDTDAFVVLSPLNKGMGPRRF